MYTKRIKYFSYRGCSDSQRRRDNSPAADTKVDYIIEVLNRCGYGVDHISRAGSSINKFIPGYIEREGINTYRYFASFGKTSSVLRIISRWFMDMQFFLWCLFNIKRGETILVYHSLGYDSTFIKLKKIKKITLIGEIEEIYQDVHKQTKRRTLNEYRFVDICDKFIFPNTLLNYRLNKLNKPNLVIHGIYRTKLNVISTLDDDHVHVLYAGTFDPVKGGAKAAIKAAQYLPSHYHLHISGFGSKSQVEDIINTIKNVCTISKCIVTYHGFLSDDDFYHLMQQCNVGLCTQDPTSLLNLTSFPSKILNYMANGLVVISGRNAAIEESYVGDLIYYYEKQEPQDIAKAMLQVEMKGMQCLDRLNKLDLDFEQNLRILLRN